MATRRKHTPTPAKTAQEPGQRRQDYPSAATISARMAGIAAGIRCAAYMLISDKEEHYAQAECLLWKLADDLDNAELIPESWAEQQDLMPVVGAEVQS